MVRRSPRLRIGERRTACLIARAWTADHRTIGGGPGGAPRPDAAGQATWMVPASVTSLNWLRSACVVMRQLPLNGIVKPGDR